MNCERCGGSGRFSAGYICYDCAGTGKHVTESVRLICTKAFEKYGYIPGDRCTGWETTPAVISQERRYIVRNWRLKRQYTLLERQVKEYFKELPKR
ncbi:hypothetical protein [Paenibacillus amylolyticus]|uniref:hypothetical protein n=1 Tax=Paenibacillus amylolyticus TaxID=1451 RepID=UPI00117FF27E|nr:hypothetical protein [Paenibacillus amylolyticus]